jgi:two-component system chemotaxis response regulator CheY
MSKTPLSKLSLLVAEDSDYYRRLVATLLRSMGILQISEARNGEEAFHQQRQRTIDIAIVDWIMAPGDGLDFTRRIRTDPESSDKTMPIIMLTAHTEESRVLAARDAGVTEILTKPISADGIYKRLHAVIMHPRPFVDAPSYVGPDRRRGRSSRPYDGSDRRIRDLAEQVSND